ncbi:MAG: hypothetical protein CBE47_02895 [Pelagibacteraceae bacterium TMED287]|nr:MAG: hypothetical protein CBE47_02895 [Pelagibacteraceae bacterium TMED287]
MSFIFGGGGSSAPASSTGQQTVTQREAPGVESRKLSLYDQASKLASTPVNIPTAQVAPISGLEQAAINRLGTTGVGSGAVTSGLASLQGAQQTAGTALNLTPFMNPYQNFVTDEITRQAQIATNRLGAQAVGAGAFGGARQGIAEAEIERARQANIGQSLASGFNTALGAAERQRNLETQTGINVGQLQGALGAQQQAMSLGDIQAQMQGGALQRGIGQQALTAARQTALQRAYEPFQRIEFLKGIMTNLPTTQSTLTATTAPGANPVGQALGTGLGAYSAYNMMQPR